MASIFGFSCVVNGGNTGLPPCDGELNRFIGAIPIPKNKTYSFTNIKSTIYGLLQADMQANDPAARIYLIKEFEVTADNGAERTTQEFAGTGNVRTLRDAKKGWTWTIAPGLCMASAYQKFNQQHRAYDFLLITESNQLVGVKRNGGFGGFRFSDFYVAPYNERMDDAAPNLLVSARIADTREWRDNIQVVVPVEGELLDLEGLLDAQPIDLNAQPLPVAGTFKIGVTVGCGGGAGSTDLIHLFETQLEDTDNWTVTNAKTRAAITLTSITATIDVDEPENSYLTFVMPTTSPYVAGDGVKFKLAGVTTLSAADMVGYEGKFVIAPNVV